MSLLPDGCYRVRRVSELVANGQRIYAYDPQWMLTPSVYRGDVYETKPDGTYYLCLSADRANDRALVWAGPFPSQTAAEVAWEMLK